MLVEETLQALQDADELMRQARFKLEAVGESKAISGTNDLLARHYLLNALAQITIGVKTAQRALVVETPEHLR